MTSKKKSPKKPRKTAANVLSGKRWHEAVIAEYVKLMSWPNVERVALGWKERKGKVTSRMCVKIYVREKAAKPKRDETLPRSTKVLIPIGRGLYKSQRVPTDVVWHAPAKFCAAPGDFLNPVESGALLGVPGNEAGTYACVVADSAGQRFALTAGHVIQSFPGDIGSEIAVVQPPTPPANMPPGASLLFGRTVGGFFGSSLNGFVDFALIQMHPGRSGVSSALDGAPGNGPILPSAFVLNNRIQVTKFGGITGRTSAVFGGSVPSIVIGGVTVTNVYEFVGLPGPLFADQGDSGSLVVSVSPGSQGGIVGLLFAVTPPTPDALAGRAFVFPFERITGFTPVQ